MGIPLPGRTDTEAPRQRLKPEALRLLPAVDPLQRHRIEAYVAGRFLLEHGAQLTRFLPMLYGLVDAAGQLQGALGLRSAAEDTLFLERYLPQRVDRMMGRLIGHAPARSELVEVGNLAANGRGSARADRAVDAEAGVTGPALGHVYRHDGTGEQFSSPGYRAACAGAG